MPEEPVSGPDWLLVARLIRPHGRRGEMLADILTDFPERFHERSRLVLLSLSPVGAGSREVELESFWFQRSRIVLKFRGVETINDAEGLRGYDVAIPASERAPLQADETYIADLVGCRLIDLNSGGAVVGEVVDVDRGSSSAELLVVRRPDGRQADDLLIPWVREYLVAVEPEKRQIRMRLPQGLLEINAPLTEEEKEQSRRASSEPRPNAANHPPARAGDRADRRGKKQKSRAGIH